LVPLREGWAAITPEGPYKLAGIAAGEFWYAAALRRFEPGELDPYVPHLRRLEPVERLWDPPKLESWSSLSPT